MRLPEHAPFNASERALVEPALQSLSAQQSAWLSGYLAATDSQSDRSGKPVARQTLTILYGSESGNSEALADAFQQRAKSALLAVTVHDMGDITPAQLKQVDNLLVVVSTWGEGDPPDRATAFYQAFMGAAAPRLENTSFAVLGLGDSSYAHFCKMGKDFDQRLETLGANRIYPRLDCDVDFEEPANKWFEAVLQKLVETADSAVSTVSQATPAPKPQAAYSKKNPFPSLLQQRILLSGRGSNKETLHLEFSLEGSGLTYEPGDALALIPTNCSEMVDAILKAGKFSDEPALRQKLSTDYDISKLSKLFMRKYNEFAQSKAIEELLNPANSDQLQAYLHGREIIDVLTDYPITGLKVDDFLGTLRKMPPRLYSIASSLKAHPDAVHLTVAVVRYQTHGRTRKGVASTFLADRIAINATAPVFIHVNKNFRLPADASTPIIMVGPGTGVAPFRAFVEERAASGFEGKSWLFFGDQKYTYDFLYQTEWQQHLKSGALTELDVAFSRDAPQKYYVQDAMRAKAKQLYSWIDAGAYFYVCGDANRMAGDVHQALIEIVKTHGNKTEADAIAYVEQMKKERRYQRDVY